MLIDTMTGGRFLLLGADEVEAHFEHVAKASRNWDGTNPNDRSLPSTTSTNPAPKGQGLFQVSGESESEARIAYLTRQLEAMGNGGAPSKKYFVEETCDLCDMVGHAFKIGRASCRERV